MKTQMIDKSNFDERQYRADLDSAYECGRASVLSVIEDIRADLHTVASDIFLSDEWIDNVIDKHISEKGEKNEM